MLLINPIISTMTTVLHILLTYSKEKLFTGLKRVFLISDFRFDRFWLSAWHILSAFGLKGYPRAFLYSTEIPVFKQKDLSAARIFLFTSMVV